MMYVIYAVTPSKKHIIRFTRDPIEAVAMRRMLSETEAEIGKTRRAYTAWLAGRRLLPNGSTIFCGLGGGEIEAAYLVRKYRRDPAWLNYRRFTLALLIPIWYTTERLEP